MPSPSISKSSIQKYLSSVKLDDVDSLLELVTRMQKVCSETRLPTRSASSLSLHETFRFFTFSNKITSEFGFESITIPTTFAVASVPTEDSEARYESPILCPHSVIRTNFPCVRSVHPRQDRRRLEYPH